ncbi:uncharacterized protein LOC121376003 [Gigantopelta aegis]|uniref:uncharacterized protein LOC121376003 n=1 Tax=Gigantopelta aegis TaxID=1735272 RepID=UPI001B88DDEC|nr:uncharacterized protein LOC121376003 [Gigantopelta aegis]
MKISIDPEAGKGLEASERSQVVYSANWKEDMLLGRQLQVLDRAQRRFVHRITIEQKVLYKRFQTKLHRSKLAYAQMWGNKDRVRALREKHMHGLNTNCYDNEEDLEFLKRLHQRPCVRSGTTRTRQGRQPEDLTNRDMDLLIRAVLDEQGAALKTSGSMKLPARPRSRPASARLDAKKHFTTRPATATGTRVDEEYLVLPSIDGETTDDKIHSYVESISFENDRRKTPDSHHASVEDRSRVSFVQTRPLTASVVRLTPDKESRNERVKSAHAQPSFRRGGNRAQLRRGSLFGEQIKPNLVEQYLSEVKYKNYESRVKEFCESLAPFESKDLNLVADYYASKFSTTAYSNLKDHIATVPGTPREEHEKYIGNTSVKSLTMQLLNLEFDKEFTDSEPTEDLSIAAISTLDTKPNGIKNSD